MITGFMMAYLYEIKLIMQDPNHNFNGSGGLLWIFLQCTVARILSCACAFCFFMTIRQLILRHENGERRIFLVLPFYYGISAGLISIFIMDQVLVCRQPESAYFIIDTEAF